MAAGIESFNEQTNLNRVMAGFKGSQWFQKPQLEPKRPFIDGYPSEVAANFRATSFPQPTPTDPWVNRR